LRSIPRSDAKKNLSLYLKMQKYSSLVELLQTKAIELGDRSAYTFLADGETETGKITYKELDRQARTIAAHLQKLVPMGSRALVVYPYHAGIEFIAAFFGCLYAGVVAVTENPPRHGQAFVKLLDRLQSAEATVILTTQELVDGLQEYSVKNPEIAGLMSLFPCLATDNLPPISFSDWQEPSLDGDTVAFLQYTSGSTGTPKGVIVTHDNVLHNSEVIYQSFSHSKDSRVAMWLPLFHDMGLIGGVMQPLYAGIEAVLMSPISLIQKPLNWLLAIDKYRITTAGGPNFAYDLLCLKVTEEQREKLDLSCWDLAFSGAEPVRAETIKRFSQLFASCGFRKEAFYPCYGMAETTLFISGGSKQERLKVKYIDGAALESNRVVEVAPNVDNSRTIVGCGRGWLGDRILIVNPDTLKECAANEVGEIWFAGASVGKGYWNNPEETERSFQARLKDGGEERFLRTGDLGFIDNGEVYITGRIKEMMILWGRNHYPQHIEATVQKSHPALRPNCGAAFSIEVTGDEERLVIVQEVERTQLRNLDLEEVIGAMRLAVGQEHLAEVYAIALLKPASIPKTSSGKIQRRVCQRMFLEEEFEPIFLWRSSLTEQSDITEMMRLS
jgi:acyl-CoA synthetase (AMP-forming)/AMP-acid ligase II